MNPPAQAPGPFAIGFDLGETLLTYADTPLNWSVLYPAALARVAAACELRAGPPEIAGASAVLARANTRLAPRRQEIQAESLFHEILERWGCADAGLRTQAIEAFFGFFQQRMMAYPETIAVLDALRLRGVRIGLLTDVPYGMPRAFVQRDLDGAGLTPRIDGWLASVDVGWRKPEPVGFRALAALLEVEPAQLWYVGNEEKDVRGAAAAGATAILIDRERRRPNWGQRHTIDSLRELLLLT